MSGMKEDFLNLIHDIYEKPKKDTIWEGETREAFPWNQVLKKNVRYHHFYAVTDGGPDWHNEALKIKSEDEKHNCYYFQMMTDYIEHWKEHTKKLWWMGEVSEVTSYKSTYKSHSSTLANKWKVT